MDITRGVNAYRTGGYEKTAFGSGSQTKRDVEERPYHSSEKRKGFRPFIYGKDLKRFKQIEAKEFINYGPWLAEPRDAKFFTGERIYYRKILSNRLVVTIVNDQSVVDQQVYISITNDLKISHRFLAGILGSKLISFFIRSYYNEADDLFPQIKVTQLRQIPIPSLDTINSTKLHKKIRDSIGTLLNFHRHNLENKSPYEKEMIQRRVDKLESIIDKLVYKLYDLTDEEIAIIEKGTA